MTAPAEKTEYRNDWVTPWSVIQTIQSAGYPIALDVAASHVNARHPHYFTEEMSALDRDWVVPHGKFWWCNPPFNNILPFIQKAHEQMLLGYQGLMILPSNTDRPMFAEIEMRGLRVLFWGTDTPRVSGRINFEDPTGKKRTANFKGSILVAFSEADELPPIKGRQWWRVETGGGKQN